MKTNQKRGSGTGIGSTGGGVNPSTLLRNGAASS